MSKLQSLILIVLLTCTVSLWSAELPSKGIERPKVYTSLSDGGFPGGPGAPVGEGVVLLIGMATAYTYFVKLRKRK